MSKLKFWTPEKLNDLQALLGTMTKEMIAEKLGTTPSAIHGICHRHGWHYAYSKNITPWTKEEDDFLRENVQTMTHSLIGKKLGRHTRAVSKRTSVLRLSGYKIKDPTIVEIYDEEDLELCRQLYKAGLSVREISEKMEVKPGVVALITNKIANNFS